MSQLLVFRHRSWGRNSSYRNWQRYHDYRASMHQHPPTSRVFFRPMFYVAQISLPKFCRLNFATVSRDVKTRTGLVILDDVSAVFKIQFFKEVYLSTSSSLNYGIFLSFFSFFYS